MTNKTQQQATASPSTSETDEFKSDATINMTEKLKTAGKKAEAQKAQRRERQVKGSHLTETLRTEAVKAGLNVEEMSGFIKITGPAKGKRVLLAKKGGRVDLSGFSIEAAAVRQVTEADAREKHLGKVRGQLDFTQSDDQVLAAYAQALSVLK